MRLLLPTLLLGCGGPEPQPDSGTNDPDPPSPTLWYPDDDGDGYGNSGAAASAVVAPAGYLATGGDCDDQDPRIHPDADEHCDYWDEDCDGIVDEDAVDAPTWYPDVDQDGYGDEDGGVAACQAPADTISQGGDCDDSRNDVHPGAWEGDCTDPDDLNCDGSVGYADSDGDGWPACLECDDTSTTTHPEAGETCNDTDDDCDGTVDEDAVDAPTWYSDSDADGYGDDSSAVFACDAPSGTVGVGGDCRDDHSEAYPGAAEVPCDGLDNDCAGDGDVRCVPAGEHDLGDAELILYGAAEGHRAGYQVMLGGDTDGDGHSEALVGAPQIGTSPSGPDYGRGIAYLLEQPAYGSMTLGDGVASSIQGDAVKDYVSSSNDDITFVDDIDGDAMDDVAVGLVSADSIYLFVGPFSGARSISTADARVLPPAEGAGLASAVTTADINGDGYADLLYGTTSSVYDPDIGWLDSAGRVWANYGPITADVFVDDADVVLYQNVEQVAFGETICASDFTGDGVADVAIGATCPEGCGSGGSDLGGGSVWLAHGPLSGEYDMNDGSEVVDADALWHGGYAKGSFAGNSLSCSGDVDGDGRPDLLVGAYDLTGDGYGTAYLIDGSLTGERELPDGKWSVTETTAGGYLASTLNSSSDLDDDGLADVAIGHINAKEDNHEVLAYFGGELSGTFLPADADATWTDLSTGYAKVAIAGGADYDGDGFDDLLIGAPGESTNGDSAGAAYLVYGGGWVP